MSQARSEDESQKGAALVLVHGFIGGQKTWGDLPGLIAREPALADYSVHPWNYPTSLTNAVQRLVTFFWNDDPGIDTLALGLRTELDALPSHFHRIILAGHSMGGLVIQSFILAEIAAQRNRHLDRLSQVILLGTPSAGLRKADWLRGAGRQLSDMSKGAKFIANLRKAWDEQVEFRRDDPTCPARFHLITVAGLKDSFVPPESSLKPFRFAEQVVVPGDHRQMVKCRTAQDPIFLRFKQWMVRPDPTPEELRLIDGRAPEAVRIMARIQAASDVGGPATAAALRTLAAELRESATAVPKCWRELGLAFLDNAGYAEAAEWLERYQMFEAPGLGRPFESDTVAAQQRAIALASAGRMQDAVALLRAMNASDPANTETKGILAGRLKRMWLKSPGSNRPASQALALYSEAFTSAKQAGDWAQAYYNGINEAYLRFALGLPEHDRVAREVLDICGRVTAPDYWVDATRAECELLMRRFADAESAYRKAYSRGPRVREWVSTSTQALDICDRLAAPQETARLRALFEETAVDPAAIAEETDRSVREFQTQVTSA